MSPIFLHIISPEHVLTLFHHSLETRCIHVKKKVVTRKNKNFPQFLVKRTNKNQMKVTQTTGVKKASHLNQWLNYSLIKYLRGR